MNPTPPPGPRRWRPRALLLPLAALAMLAGGGCVRSEQPLSPAADAKPDLRLIGQWHDAGNALAKGGQGGDVRITFDDQGLGHLAYQRQLGGPFEADPNVPSFFVTRTPHASYLNLRVFDQDQTRPGPSGPAHYEFYWYALSDDHRTLLSRGMQTEPFRRAVLGGGLRGQIEKTEDGSDGDNILLQDSSETILKFIESASSAELLGVPATLTRTP